jgi:ribosomal protein L18E
MDHDSTKVLERNVQLEHLLSELTEYLSAKEMQLETFKQVNDALQTEIRDLAKANMSKNDI